MRFLEDVTVGGVPCPNAWLGGLKGRNLMEGYKNDDPFLKAFAEGIEDLEVVDGELRVLLAE